MSDHSVCNQCFYRYRMIHHFQCPHQARKIEVKWNVEESRLETTSNSIRPLPPNLPGAVRSGYVGMCDPRRGNCRNDQCTYAHGREEQRQWNKILRSRRENNEGRSSYSEFIKQLFNQPGFVENSIHS